MINRGPYNRTASHPLLPVAALFTFPASNLPSYVGIVKSINARGAECHLADYGDLQQLLQGQSVVTMHAITMVVARIVTRTSTLPSEPFVRNRLGAGAMFVLFGDLDRTMGITDKVTCHCKKPEPVYDPQACLYYCSFCGLTTTLPAQTKAAACPGHNYVYDANASGRYHCTRCDSTVSMGDYTRIMGELSKARKVTQCNEHFVEWDEGLKKWRCDACGYMISDEAYRAVPALHARKRATSADDSRQARMMASPENQALQQALTPAAAEVAPAEEQEGSVSHPFRRKIDV